MPMPAYHPVLKVPLVSRRRDPRLRQPDRVALALECATGRVRQVAGAFAA